MTNAETGGEGALVISVQIPQGCEPGDSLSFEANGQSFTIEVPAASVAGEVLQIKLAGESSAANENSDSDDCDRITIETATGSKITIVQEISAQTSSKSRSDGTHQMLWNATRFIVNWLGTPDFRREILRSKHVHSVLELGAGHGILGMAFVDVLSKTLTPDKILKLVLTDVEEALPQLESNIRLNREVLGEKVDASALVLEWHKQSFSQANNKFDYILGSDLLYNLSVIPDLVTTIRRLLSKSTKILFSIRWRKPSEERRFFSSLSDIIDWKLLHGDCKLSYDIYGNGSFESDKYFSQSTVSVNGKMLPLSSVDEHSCEQMSAKEFERFEELQTQIYLGEVRENQMDVDHAKKRRKFE